MTADLMKHFSSQGKTRTERAGLQRLLEYPLQTGIGRQLLADFAESDGRMSYHSGPVKSGNSDCLGTYSPNTNHVALSSLGNGSTTVHEAAHARQWRKAPDMMMRTSSPVKRAQRSIVLEADSWAMTSIYMKQFFAEHIDDYEAIARFMRKSKTTLERYDQIDPFVLEKEDTPESHTTFWLKSTFNYLADKKHGYEFPANIVEMFDRHVDEICDPTCDHVWASRTFKTYVNVVRWQQSDALHYVRTEMREFFDHAVKKNPSHPLNNVLGDNLERHTEARMLQEGILKIADMRDIGIDASYIVDKDRSDMTWCTKPQNIVYSEAVEISQWVSRFGRPKTIEAVPA